MNDSQTIRYHFRPETVEDLARSLIVASAMVPDAESVKIPFTGVQARHLGRALEAMSGIEASNAAAREYVDTRARAAAEAEVQAAIMLDRALRQNRAAILWLFASVAPLVLNVAVRVLP